MTKHNPYFAIWAGVFLALTLVGFAPSFFLKFVFDDPGALAQLAGAPSHDGGLPWQVIAHGLFATAWIVLFFVQSLLITRGRSGLHRTLGPVGAVVAVGVVATGVTAIALAIPRLVTLARPDDPDAFLAQHLPAFFGDLGSFVAFGLIVTTAVLLRRKPDHHKRLMLVATMILIPPALGRILPMDWLPIAENTLAITVIASDWIAHRRPPWATVAPFTFWIALYTVFVAAGS